MSGENVVIWTIYRGASDRDGAPYTVRSFTVTPHGMLKGKAQGFPTLEEARAPLEMMGLYNLGREIGDDPVIVESWF